MRAKVWCEMCGEEWAEDVDGDYLNTLAEKHVEQHYDGDEPGTYVAYARTEDGILPHYLVEEEAVIERSAWPITAEEAAERMLAKRQS